jgi:hypothetical protein
LVRFYAGVAGDPLRAALEFRMPFLSAISDNAWDFVGADWELAEAVDRRKLKAARRNQFTDLSSSTHNSVTADPAKALAHLESQWSLDPRAERRHWQTWWAPNA